MTEFYPLLGLWGFVHGWSDMGSCLIKFSFESICLALQLCHFSQRTCLPNSNLKYTIKIIFPTFLPSQDTESSLLSPPKLLHALQHWNLLLRRQPVFPYHVILRTARTQGTPSPSWVLRWQFPSPSSHSPFSWEVKVRNSEIYWTEQWWTLTLNPCLGGAGVEWRCGHGSMLALQTH